MHGISQYLKLLLIILILILTANGLFVFLYLDGSAQDTALINKLGIIRGTIQRYTKRELMGIPSTDLENQINSLLRETEKARIFSLRKEGLNQARRNLAEAYSALELEIHSYRENRSDGRGDLILQQSETIWELADETVLLAQQTFEAMKKFLYFHTASLVLAFLLVFFLIRQIKKKIRDHLEYDAHYDLMTNTRNRAFFMAELERHLSRQNRREDKLSLIMLDIDHFKAINDQYGHARGDDVLKGMTRSIQRQIRTTDIFGRLGGEEFAILLPDASLEDAAATAEKLRQLIETTTLITEQPITISLGVSSAHDEDTSDSLLERADKALYRAKKGGRNQVEQEAPPSL